MSSVKIHFSATDDLNLIVLRVWEPATAGSPLYVIYSMSIATLSMTGFTIDGLLPSVIPQQPSFHIRFGQLWTQDAGEHSRYTTRTGGQTLPISVAVMWQENHNLQSLSH